MLRKLASIGGILVFSSATLLADFSYQQKSTLTGGALKTAMKVAGVFSKQAREPMESTIAVKGNRMITRSATHMSIIDLDKETFTNVDLQKKSYSVMTFAQFKQAMEQMQAKMKEKKADSPDMEFKFTANPAGATRNIAGFDTRETIITINMQATDPDSGQTGAMVVTTDAWIAPSVPGYQEVREFHKRMAAKLDWSPGGGLFGSRPDVSKGMAEAARHLSDMDGMPVYEVVSMGAAGGPTGQPGAQPQQQSQSSSPSVGSSIGSALGGRFGLGRKKQQPQQPPPSDQQAAGSTTPTGVPNGLVEMTIEMSNFSSAPVDSSQLEIPAGFKQVEPDLRRGQ